MTHANSLDALDAIATVKVERSRAVRVCYEQHGPLTDRAVAEILFGPGADPNLARPRITEGVKSGEFYEVDSVKDNVTGHNVRRCDVRKSKPFCNCTFAGFLKKQPSKKRPGFVAVVCTNPIHGRPVLYGYEQKQP